VDLSRPSLRLLALFAAVAIPPLIALAAVMAFEPGWVTDVGVGTALLLAAIGGALWAIVMAWIGSRAIGRDLSRLVELAERGVPPALADGEEVSGVQRRLASALEERNRQIASLAAAVNEAPVSATPAEVVRSVVTMARDVTGDPTWQLAITRSAAPELLKAGVYDDHPASGPGELADLHRWAVSTDERGGPDTPARARFAAGPWGAFLLVDASAGEPLSAVLLAPREGRAVPSQAELDLLSVLGLQAATAIDHALLFARVRSQADELNRMAAVQTDFLRGVTHDLQTPLTSIRALASELIQSGAVDPAARTDLDTIANQAERLRRMVSQLLVASRLEAGAVSANQEVLRAEPIIRRTWDALRADRRFELVDDGPPHLIIADPDRLEQVVWAVLDNAVKYSQPGTLVRVRESAAIPPEAADAMSATIEISDEGAGMDPLSQQSAFDQFYRSDVARRLAPDGSGVGLYAARGLMRAMGGEMWLASALGRGTTVTLKLPAEPIRTPEGAGSPRVPNTDTQ
jgi:signal transduction histidine kinase